MSFSFSFTAKTVADAHNKLAAAYAPLAVKLLVEKAIDAIPSPPTQANAGSAKPPGVVGAESGAVSRSQPKPPELIGVFVEAWGHLAIPGDGNPTSQIQKFEVRGLFG